MTQYSPNYSYYAWNTFSSTQLFDGYIVEFGGPTDQGVQATAAPEPTSLILFPLAAAGLLATRKRGRSVAEK